MALKVGELFASFDLDASGMTGTIRTIETQLEGIGADMIRAGSTLSSMVTDPLKGIGKSILSAGMVSPRRCPASKQFPAPRRQKWNN